MADDDRPLGAALAEARRQRGLSVEDVAAATRIRATIVRAIEDDDFAACGGAVYARGHMRAIAQLVGTDARPLVAEFDRRFHQPVPALTTSSLAAFDPPRDAGRSGRQSPSWASVAVGVLAVAVLLLGASWLLGRGGGADQVGALPAASSPAVPPASPTPTATPPAQPAVHGVTLRLRATGGSSWVLVTASDGSQLFQGILADGDAREFKDGRQLSVRFGNSPAVRVVQNGRDVGAPRCDTQVCTVAFGPAAVG
ncbi:MAG: helix-turn-helix domain-containing protein [Mycobacteriales bacterium]